MAKNQRKFESWEIDYMRSHWPSVETRAAIAKHMGRTINSVSYQASKLGLKRPQVNHEFFDSWSHDMAYVLGLTVTDGSIDKRGLDVRIKLQAQDVDILEKVKVVMHIPAKIRYIKSSSSVIYKGSSRERVIKGGPKRVLSIGSQYIVKRLAALGVHPKKSLREVLPPVPKEFMPDFLRGFFDGDGGLSTGVQKGSKNQPSVLNVYFLGNYTILNEIRIFIARELSIESGFIDKGVECSDGSVLHHLNYSKVPGQAILKWLYDSSSVLFLNRKKNKYLSYFSSEEKGISRREVLQHERMAHVWKVRLARGVA